MDEQTPDQEKRSGAPDSGRDWADGAEIFTIPTLPGVTDDTEDSADSEPSKDRVDGGDRESTFNPRSLDDYSSDEYTGHTTQEYQGLAEEVSRAAEEEWELQAVAATVPGVDSGLVGFDDVTGASSTTEEDYEASEQAMTSDLAIRVASALVIFGMFLGTLLLGGWWFTGFVILVMVVGLGEFYATLRSDDYRPLALFGLLGVLLMGLGAHISGAVAIAGWASAFAVITILFLALSPRRQPLEDASVTIGGMAWVGLLSFAILIASGPQPVAFILFVVLLVAANDIGAYFVGRAFGQRKMSPRLSPQKTWEGFFGGLVAGLVVSSVLVTFPAWETIGLAKGLVAAALIGVMSPIGDAAESMVKRSLGVKDMGSVLPGHGGLLDRIDGFLFAVPAIYYLFRGFGLL
ncbi:MAG: phosphatidate cytidylyltransferase [Actinomycetota bacterium]|nr:phosphatidate cytidylyltransferase [Actinomycetota bacterium]